MRKRAILVATALLLFGAACSDDDDGDAVSTDNEYVQAMLATIEGDDSIPISEDEAACLVSRWIGAIGVDTLEAAGVTPEDLGRDNVALNDFDLDLTDDQARTMARAFGACDIALADLMVADLPPDAAAEVRDCVADNVDEDAVAERFAQDVLGETGDDGDLVWMLELAAACPGLLEVTPDE